MPEVCVKTRPCRSSNPPGRWGRRRIGAGALLILALNLAGCSTSVTPNMLNPQGSAAAEINDLWWLMFWLAMFVFVAVLLLAGIAIYRSRRRNTEDPHHRAASPAFFLTAGGVIPLLILIPLIVVSIQTSRNVSLSAEQDTLTIEVIGHQWWWEVRYPAQGIVTANEIHIPAGERVTFRITTQDVIHSFWVPQLHGKIDMIPGRANVLHLEAAAPGEYMGICAEFCGVQHTFMLFWVIAHPPETFDAWVSTRQQTGLAATNALQARGQAVFYAANCHQCHQIRGITEPDAVIGAVGPNLTHLASRDRIAAGRIGNSEETLAAFITNPESIKPGVHMPASPLSADDLDALVAFLLSLE